MEEANSRLSSAPLPCCSEIASILSKMVETKVLACVGISGREKVWCF